MLKVCKKILIILLIVIMEIILFSCKIISKFWGKYNRDIKKTFNEFHEALRRELA